MLFATIECTSAVSSDVEGQMYKHAKMLGITLITISLRYVACSSTHARVILYCGPDADAVNARRPSLAKYHTQLLTLTGDGTGSWTLTRVGTEEERMGIGREIEMLRRKLKEVETWEERVKALEVLLGPGPEGEREE